MKNNFNIVIWQEWKFFVWKVLENDISSFWNTKEECLYNIKEALSLYLEDNNLISNIKINSPCLEKLELNYA
jgi:predicted RNase H-like HicB family nuclease